MQFFAPTHVYLENDCVRSHKEELLSFAAEHLSSPENILPGPTVPWRMCWQFWKKAAFHI